MKDEGEENMRVAHISILTLAAILLLTAIAFTHDKSDSKTITKEVMLITLDPGHFDAALVQKRMNHIGQN